MNSSVRVGSRSSALAQAQVKEVLSLLRKEGHEIDFEMIWIKTQGDLDLTTSLKAMEKTDFFTREIEERQLQGEFAISIHSAKDLPESLQAGLEVIALTQGVDSSDVLVLQEKTSFEELPKGARIGVSSVRREQTLAALRSDLCFVDLRGPIEQRLDLLFRGDLHGVVVAEAALIRLQLTHLNRMVLSKEGAPLQGQLAVVACEENEAMRTLFSPLDCR